MEIHIDGFLIDLFPLENWIGLFAVMPGSTCPERYVDEVWRQAQLYFLFA